MQGWIKAMLPKVWAKYPATNMHEKHSLVCDGSLFISSSISGKMFAEKWWIQETELSKIWFLSLSTGEGVKDKHNGRYDPCLWFINAKCYHGEQESILPEKVGSWKRQESNLIYKAWKLGNKQQWPAEYELYLSLCPRESSILHVTKAIWYLFQSGVWRSLHCLNMPRASWEVRGPETHWKMYFQRETVS